MSLFKSGSRVITDEELMAYADGELDDARTQEIGRAIDTNPELAARLRVFRLTGRALGPHFDPILEEQPPAALLQAIRSAPISGRRPSPRESVATTIGRVLQSFGFGPSPWPVLAGIATGLIIGAAATMTGHGTGDEAVVAERDGALVATGPLDRTLETDTMEASRAGAVKIVATFADEAGRWCRLYQGAGHSGLACRQAAHHWQIIALGEGSGGTDSSPVPSGGGGAQAVDDLAASMMTSSAALDAQTEAELVSRAWEAQ
jgi:hypothetical protein